jgi:hypothetical protein
MTTYNVDNTRGALVTQVLENSLNTDTDITLIGKNRNAYGEVFNENLIKMLENFASTTAPARPQEGQCWWDISTKKLKVYTDNVWKAVGSPLSSPTTPVGAEIKNGDLWYDTTNKQLRIYDEPTTTWKLIGPDYPDSLGLSGQVIGTITDTASASHTVINFYAGNQLIAIMNKDPEFTPAAPGISGFTTIKPGLNFSSAIAGIVLSGTAANSLALNSLSSSQFMRSDTNTSTSGTLAVNNNTGLTVGTGANLALSMAGSVASIRNNTTGGNLSLAVDIAGSSTTAVRVNTPAQRVEIPFTTASTNKTTGALTITGGVGISGNLHVGNVVADNIDVLGTLSGTITGAAELVTLVPTNDTNATHFVSFVDAAIGNKAVRTDTSLTYNPSTNQLTVGNISAANSTFSGNVAVTGNISATNVTGTLLTSAQTNITSIGTLASLTVTGNISAANVVTVGGQGVFGSVTGTLQTAAQPNITSIGNLSTGNIATLTVSTLANVTATTAATSRTTGALRVAGGVGIQGNLWADVGNFGNINAGTISGTIVGSAEKVTTVADNATNASYPLAFAENATGPSFVYTDDSLTYNPATNIINSTIANVSLVNTETTASTHYVNFTSATTGSQPIRTDSTLTFNPSTNTLTVGNLAITGSINQANFDASAITSGTIATARLSGTYGISVTGSAGSVSGVVAIVNGGTGGNTAAAARTNLGLSNAATITAASTNTGNQIVLRDGSGNFSAGTITATLSGNVSGSTGSFTTSVTTASLLTDRDVAINTTTPGLSSAYGIHFSGQVTAGQASGITWRAAQGQASNAGAGIYVTGSSNSSTMLFATSNNYATGSITRLAINSAGNVGIGTTSPISSLDVNGAIRSASGSDPGTRLAIWGDGTSPFAGQIAANELRFNTGNDSGRTTRVTILNTGNVGIGTGSPVVPLDVVANSADSQAIQIRGRSADGNGVLRFMNNSSTTQYSAITSTASAFSVVATANIPLTFGTNNAERMRISSGGFVGIGTVTPVVPLDVISDSSALGIQVRGRSSDNLGGLLFKDNASTVTYASMVSSADGLLLGTGASVTRTLRFSTNNIERMRITAAGTVEATGDIVAFTASDARLKTNIETIPNALDKIAKLKGVTFFWNDIAKEIYPERTTRDVGVIAQEVQAVLPEVVTERDNGYLAVRYEKLVPLLVEAIKELKTQVQELQSKLQ